VKYNLDGDLLFTSAKDQKPTVWYADTGVRLGTYGKALMFSQFHKFAGPHKGAVWDLDPSWDSQYLVTACADGSARLFETCTGKYICKMPHRGYAFSFLFPLL
jgi:translation initiation factor 3 subunit I